MSSTDPVTHWINQLKAGDRTSVQPLWERYFGQMADLKTKAQLLRSLVKQQDREYFIVDDALHHLGHALQERVQVQRSVEHVRYFDQ